LNLGGAEVLKALVWALFLALAVSAATIAYQRWVDESLAGTHETHRSQDADAPPGTYRVRRESLGINPD
jgi:hypothetical protein